MDDVLGGVFASHVDYDHTWVPADILAPIHEESLSYNAGDTTSFEPSTKRVRISYDCELCGTSYTEKRSLTRHCNSSIHCERVGQPLRNFRCAICSAEFARDDIRQRHQREQHVRRKRPQHRPKLFHTLTEPSTNCQDILANASSRYGNQWLAKIS